MRLAVYMWVVMNVLVVGLAVNSSCIGGVHMASS
jgi:hypothetical protein